MRLCARRLDSTSLLPYLLPFLLLFLVPTACDDGGDGSTTDGGGRTDAAASDAPAATGACTSLTAGSELKGTISTDATWRGVIAVTGQVIVREAKITIEAGTTFVMGADASLEIGWNSSMASLFARGTEAAPIRFCGKEARAGYFDQIIVGSKVTSDSVLEHVAISDGGQLMKAALELNAAVLVKNVLVTRSGADGVHAADFKEGSEKLTVTGAAKIAAVLTDQKAVSRLPLGGAYGGNGTNAIALRYTDMDADTTFREPGVPYIQERTVETSGGKLTFLAGVDYRLAVDQTLEVGWNSNEASIVTQGTADKPVLFGRTTDSAGGFRSLLLGNKVRSDSVLKHVKVRGGGNGAPALDIRAAITINHVTLEMNQTGLNLEGTGFSNQSTALTITTTTGGPPATVLPGNAVTLPRGGTFTGNMKDWIVIKDGDYTVTAGTLPNLGVPYRVEGEFRTMGSTALTIEAGTTFLMAPDSTFEFGWNSNMARVTAVGTAGSPIVWKGAEPVNGYWNGLIVGSMVLSDSKFDFVEVRHGGKADGAALRLNRAFDVKNTKFAGSMGWGIMKTSGDANPYTGDGNTFEMCAAGNVGAP